MWAFIRTTSLFCLIQLSSYDCINAFSMTIPFGQQQHQKQSSHAFTKINPAKNAPSAQLSENVLSAVNPTKDVMNGVNSASPTETTITSEEKQTQTKVAYRSVFIPMDEHDGVQVPVALWYPANTNEKTSQTAEPSSPDDNLIMEYPESGSSSSIANRDEETNASIKPAVYNHRISVTRIGELLAGWNLPKFLNREFDLTPTLNDNEDDGVIVTDGSDIPLPQSTPVILMAHGYLGSRFDLSHLAESLAQRGFLCISPEYPESLAASYPRTDGLDRSTITQRAFDYLSKELSVTRTSTGIVGHSLGTGTVMFTGDESWTRVCIAGFPGEREDIAGGPVLLISSVNDGAVTMSRMERLIPSDFERFREDSSFLVPTAAGSEERTVAVDTKILPKRAAFIFENTNNAPNHISFLAGSVNDSMIALLSPLLPVAQMMNIPVLDFDKYKVSQDSKPTADVTIPLICSYLEKHML